jgi:hypothetical protein
MVALCDQAGTVRAGEELDLARLRPFLLERFGDSGPVFVEQFPSGHHTLLRASWHSAESGTI